MYVKVTRSGPRRYVQLVEAYRDPVHGTPRQRYVATLGRLDQLTAADVDGVIDGLLRLTDHPDLATLNQPVSAARTTFEAALQLGDVWVLDRLWRQLGLGAMVLASLRGRSRLLAMERCIRVLVFNRLSDPESKLGVLRWLPTVCVPGVDGAEVTHARLLRAMDALWAGQAVLDSGWRRGCCRSFPTPWTCCSTT